MKSSSGKILFENGLKYSGALDVPTPEHPVTPYTADVPLLPGETGAVQKGGCPEAA